MLARGLDLPGCSVSLGAVPSTPGVSRRVEAPAASGVAGVPPLWALGAGAVGVAMDTQDPPRHVLDPSCFHRDLLPFTLRLPQAILEASSFTDLKTIANLGLGKSARGPRGWRGSRKRGPRTAPAGHCAER